jgi:hypothetical protein
MLIVCTTSSCLRFAHIVLAFSLPMLVRFLPDDGVMLFPCCRACCGFVACCFSAAQACDNSGNWQRLEHGEMAAGSASA